ncbi:leucine-rich repeat-containing protein 4B-like [Patella vulgata]|uniref:leucine-rich repeat-containing protein 4B-like n=1 Tax=Patella vulgata TaxID=6465 RepID=UPI0024A95C81|nr:leucine-rich repeat-containing protein 4B-like [Patella vulgata]
MWAMNFFKFIMIIMVHVCLVVADYDDYCLTKNDRVICDDDSMTEIPKGIPKSTKSLVILGKPSAQFNIPRLRKLDFKGLGDLEEIFITFAQVKTVDQDTFLDLKQLKRVDLTFNKISTIYQQLFLGLYDLEDINLSGNEYCELQPGAVANLPSLRNLYLADMNLRTLHISSFRGLDSLLHLDIAGNDLRKLEKSLFDPLKNLVSLDISSNRIKGLDKDLETPLSKLQSLNMGNNPWQCNCGMKWIKNLPSKFIYDTVAYSADRVVVCKGPDNLIYKNLVDVPDDQLACTPASIKDCKKLAVEEGQPGDISCIIDGDPFPDITWNPPGGASAIHTDDLEDNKNYSVSDNGTLTIKSVKMDQNGVWKIVVQNVLGADSTKVSVNVTQKATPTEEAKSGNGVLIGACAGGGVALLCLIIIIAVCCKNKKNKVGKVSETP